MPFFLLLTALALSLLLWLLVHSWRQTPYGRLAALPAALLRLVPAPPQANISIPEERKRLHRLVRIGRGRRLPVRKIDNFMVPGPGGSLQVRLYHPRPEEMLPVILYFHGGGWRMGDLDTHDPICRRLAAACRWPVLSIDYRRTPEHPFPAALDDAYAALQWVAGKGANINADPERITVMGDSAGGNLAAAIALRARDEGGPAIYYQVLIYPVLDLSRTDRESYRHFATGYFLTRERVRGFIDDYVPDPDQRIDPYASPLLASTHAGLPPAYILTAAFDPLLSEGAAYAERLEAAGVPVIYDNYEGMIHGFFGMPVFGRAAIRAVKRVGTVLKEGVEAI
jgi:acetyl esterase